MTAEQIEKLLASKDIAFSIDIDVYRQDLIFVYGGTEKSQKRRVKKMIDKRFYKHLDALYYTMSEIKSYRGLYSSAPPLKIITIKNQESFWDFQNILVHETLHAAFDILRGVGVEPSEQSEEAYTYLQQHIFEQINYLMFKEDGEEEETISEGDSSK